MRRCICKYAINQLLFPSVAMGWVLPLLCNIYFIGKVCSVQASGILCNLEKIWLKYRLSFNFLKYTVFVMRGEKKSLKMSMLCYIMGSPGPVFLL